MLYFSLIYFSFGDSSDVPNFTSTTISAGFVLCEVLDPKCLNLHHHMCLLERETSAMYLHWNVKDRWKLRFWSLKRALTENNILLHYILSYITVGLPSILPSFNAIPVGSYGKNTMYDIENRHFRLIISALNCLKVLHFKTFCMDFLLFYVCLTTNL